MRALRTVNWLAATIVLLGLGTLGLYNGIRDITAAGSALQRTVYIGGFLYGVFGLWAGVTLIFRKRIAIPFAIAWAISVSYTAAVASFAFSDPDFSEGGTLIGVIAAGVATILISAWVIWAARLALREDNLTPGIREGDIPSR